MFKSISVTGTISFVVSEKINKDKKNNERRKIIKLGCNVIFEISMEYFKARTYQSSLEHYKWNLVGHLGILGLDMALFYACYVIAGLGRALVG